MESKLLRALFFMLPNWILVEERLVFGQVLGAIRMLSSTFRIDFPIATVP